MADVQLDNVSKVYRNRREIIRALTDMTLSVADGELIVLAGPSGCGKTTALRLIAGLEEAGKGTIRIGDRLVNHVEPKDRDVAMVFQNFALYPHMTVFKNIAFPLKMRGTPKAEIPRRVGEVAAKLGIEPLLERRPGSLSGGEMQRVAVARAIVRRPKVFLLDEPLSNLDASLRGQLRTELKSLQRELGTTMIYVTHDQEEAMTLGDRMVILEKGFVRQCGAPMELYDRPANRFVAGFVGTPRMNFFPGRLEIGDEDARFVGRFGSIMVSRSAMPTHGPGGEVLLGVRPHDLLMVPAGDGRGESSCDSVPTNNGSAISAVVHLVEPLGTSTTVHLKTAGGDSIAVQGAPRAKLPTGQEARIRFDTEKIHLFAGDDSGRRLN